MRLRQFITGLVGVAGVCLLGGLPAKAGARLQAWQFDTGQNRLVFTTESGVEPQVSLSTHPHQLIIDLPGILSDDALGNQFVGGAVRAVRVIQANGNTTRMVLDLSPDYNLDPRQVKVWGLTNQQWVVQLPSSTQSMDPDKTFPNSTLTIPDFSKAAPSRPLTAVGDEPLPPLIRRNQLNRAAVRATATVVGGVQTTAEGFFIPTAGAAPQIQVYRTREVNQARQITIDLLDAAIASGLTAEALPQGRYGIQRWSLTQFATDPPAIRVTLTLDGHSPDWQITPLASGGIWLTPIGVAPSQIIPPHTTVALPVINAAAAPPPINHSVAPPSVAYPNPQPAVVPQPAGVSGSNPSRPNLGQVLVMLDPGHGGVDPGAVGIGGLQEKGVVLAVAQYTAAALQAQGIAVQMTRQSDQTVELQPRTERAEAARSTVFVSIHANAVNMQRQEVNGVETYYYSEAGQVLATALQQQVLGTMAMNDRGVRQARFFVLRRTSMPAALIEIGFVTGATDAPKLRDPRWQAQMGQSIAQGILNYLRSQAR